MKSDISCTRRVAFREYFFSAHGLGFRFIEAILQRDYFLATTLTLFFGFLLTILNLVFDLILYKLDPRIRIA